MESWSRRDFSTLGIEVDFVQDNHSRSLKGTLRGLHYQIQNPQGKLVRATVGSIFDVAVDMRLESATFGRWVGVTLSADNRRQLWIPPGFAHGFYVVSDVAEVQYKCTEYYAPKHERCILWDDNDLAIDWPISNDAGVPCLSAKDQTAMKFSNAEVYSIV